MQVPRYPTKMIMLRNFRLNIGSPADSPGVKNGMFLNSSESVYVKTSSIVALITLLYIKIFIPKPDNFDAVFNRNFLAPPGRAGVRRFAVTQPYSTTVDVFHARLLSLNHMPVLMCIAS